MQVEFTLPEKRKMLAGDVDQCQNSKLGPNYLASVKHWV